MESGLVALIAGASAQSMILERSFAQNGQKLRRYSKFEDANEDPEVDVILIEDIIVHNDLPLSDAVVIGLNVRPRNLSRYDAVLNYPVKWEKFLQALDTNSDNLFDEKIRDEIRELLGPEMYKGNLQDLIGEVNGVVKEFAANDINAQISMVHKISGVSAMLGVRGLHHELLALEIKGKSGENEGFYSDWARFVRQWPSRRDKIVEFAQG